MGRKLRKNKKKKRRNPFMERIRKERNKKKKSKKFGHNKSMDKILKDEDRKSDNKLTTSTSQRDESNDMFEERRRQL